MDKRVKENASVVTAAEESARASAESAQETADRFAGSVGAVVQNANAQINASKAQVDQAKTEVDETVTTVAQAVQTANQASASAQASATTVSTYGTRLTTVEDKARDNKASIDHLDIETLDLYDRDANNVKLHYDHEQVMTGGLKVGGHDLTKAVTTDVYQTITGRKDFENINISTSNGGFSMVNHSDPSTTSAPSSLCQNIIVHRANDDSINAMEQHIHNTDGSKWYQYALTAQNGNHRTVLVNGCDSNGNALTSSNVLVTRGDVSATDGTTNNLVHTIGNESVSGTKTHFVDVNNTTYLRHVIRNQPTIASTGLNRSAIIGEIIASDESVLAQIVLGRNTQGKSYCLLRLIDGNGVSKDITLGVND